MDGQLQIVCSLHIIHTVCLLVNLSKITDDYHVGIPQLDSLNITLKMKSFDSMFVNFVDFAVPAEVVLCGQAAHDTAASAPDGGHAQLAAQ